MFAAKRVCTASADPTVRSALYKLLELGLRYPTQEMFEAFQSGAFHAELLEHISQIPHLEVLALGWDELTAKAQQELRQVSFEDLEVRYVQVFEAGMPEPPCPPYEGLCREGEQRAVILLEISSFYKHFGLAMSQVEGKRELPDHLCAQLEFLHFLTFKEADSPGERDADMLKGYRRAQKDFVERHLANWLPMFVKRIENACPIAFYVHLAKLTAKIAAAELEWLTASLEEDGEVAT